MAKIHSLVDDFAKQLSRIIESQVLVRARAAVATALGGAHIGKRGPGRPPKAATLAARVLAGPVRHRRKAPPQLCPVPGCKNRAAPIFGMVCSDHRNVPKTKIRKYREARRAQKMKKKNNARGKARGRGRKG